MSRRYALEHDVTNGPYRTMPSGVGKKEKPLRGLVMPLSAALGPDLGGHVRGLSFRLFELDLTPFVLLGVEYPRIVEVVG